MLMNRPGLWGSFALIAGMTVASLSFSAAAPPAAKPSDSDEIRELLAERIEILKERVKMAVSGYDSGTLEFGKVHEARRDYLNAKLDLSVNIAERIAVLKEIVAEAEAARKRVAEAVEAHIGDRSEVLKAKAYVLEARVALARAELEK
jgi:outer membrane protein TolC